MGFRKITEESSSYTGLDKMSIDELIAIVNKEDKLVALAVEKALPQISALIKEVVLHLQSGGRLFYIGAGTSGRLGILDASEMPPSFGVSEEMVQGIIAGGEKAIVSAVEFAEDDTGGIEKIFQDKGISQNDMVIGISASGSTPFVLRALQYCRSAGITSGSVCNNPESPISGFSDFPVEVITGPEVITGSTRMKAATAQKMVLNMISSTAMIRLGRVKGNKMTNLMPLNKKLSQRAIQMIMEELGINDAAYAGQLLEKHGSAQKAIAACRR